MNKKFLSVTLFSALMLGTAGTFTSCKDYDDDIKNLQEQLDKKASLEDLNAKVSTLQTAVDEAKTAAKEAKDKAQEALDKAGSAEGGVSDDDLKDLKKELQDQIDKLASLDAVDKKIASLKDELKGDFVTDEKLKDLAAEVDALSAQVMSIIGHRLTSLAVIPTSHINGIAAITLTTLQYTPQEYKAMAKHADGPQTDKDSEGTFTAHSKTPVLDHVNKAGAKPYTVSTDKNEAYFHVSPNIGVRTEDIYMPSFDCIKSENILTKAGATISENSPIQPTDYKIKDNVLTVQFKKTVAESINEAGGHASGKETFYMASLKAPIAKENLTADEAKALKENGTQVYVNSEYVRLHETKVAPYIANARTMYNGNMGGDFADEVQTDGEGRFYVHYHDSICAYESQANDMIDVYAQYNKVLDLKKLVEVCTTEIDATDHKKHAELEKYKDYGLTFRFYKATGEYFTLGGPEGNSNKTDQQKFAEIDSPMNGHMTSAVYSLEGGVSATAVGREPLVRVELVDTVNNALVAMRYIKVKWVKEEGMRELGFTYDDTMFKCGDFADKIGTVAMNEVIYAGAKDGGMTKQEFHAVYTDAGFDAQDGVDYGKVKLIKNTEDGVESYNIEWTLTHADIVKKYPVWKNHEDMVFTKTFFWKDPTKAYPTLKITLTRTIYKPTFGGYGYDNRYWKKNTNNTVFNVNPVVYGAVEWNPAWNETRGHILTGDKTNNNPTVNIYTDLVNGFLNKDGVKPATGAWEYLYFQDKNVANVKNPYSPTFDLEGVRFEFDAEKLAGRTYKYFDVASKTFKDGAVTLSTDNTKLYIAGELAATIDNYKDNLCTFVDNPLKGHKTYNIKLQEADPDAESNFGQDTKPTEAAKALVGQIVPVKLVADLCYGDATPGHPAAHTEVIKAYDANIIEPMTITVNKEEGEVTDAVVNGSSVDVTGAYTYTCWNADENGNFYTASEAPNATALQKELFKFYECTPSNWMTDQVKTNLKLVDGNLQPVAGYKEGKLPANTTVVYNVDATTGKETLTYYNHSGTPVNWDYEIYVPIKFGYKWKTFTQEFKIHVNENAGTPAGR
ncbi:hypothetical protein [Bacteroides uniformis]|uniref:hypothetical protein n=1 Tax=Bacteroides uniformis TaxID=820 RepID=UPI003984003A